MKFEEKIDLPYEEKNISYASSEMEGVYIFVCLESEEDNYLLLNEILYFVIEKFLFNFNYSKKNIMELINLTNTYYLEKISENKEIDINKISLLVIISDYNKLSLVNMGHFRINLLRQDKVINQIFEDTVSYYMFTKNELDKSKIYTSKYYNLLTKYLGNNEYTYNIFDLEENDKIIIQSKESVRQCQDIPTILNNQIDFKEKYMNVTLTLNEKNSKSIYQDDFKLSFKNIFLIFSIISIFLFFTNYIYISLKINDLQSEIYDYKKIEYTFENKDILNEIILKYKILNKKLFLIYLSFNKNKIDNLKEEIELLKKEYDNLKNILADIDYIDKNIKLNLDKSKLEIIKSNLLNISLTNISKINENILVLNNKIDKYIYLKTQEDNIDKLLLENNYEKVFNIYDELLTEYRKLKDDDAINELNLKLINIKENLYELHATIENLEKEYSIYKKTDIEKALKILNRLKDEYVKINNSKKIEEIQNYIYDLEKEREKIIDEINFLEKNIEKNIRNENYSKSLNKINEIITLYKKLNMNSKVKYYQNLKLEIQKNKKNKENIDKNLKELEKISNTNKINYEKAKKYEEEADKYLKNNEIDLAIKNYLIAIELIKNDSSVKIYYDKLIKKIEYIRKK